MPDIAASFTRLGKGGKTRFSMSTDSISLVMPLAPFFEVCCGYYLSTVADESYGILTTPEKVTEFLSHGGRAVPCKHAAAKIQPREHRQAGKEKDTGEQQGQTMVAIGDPCDGAIAQRPDHG